MDSWAVCHHGYCLGRDGGWDFEPSPSNRDKAWLRNHRFDLDTALALAKEHFPKVRINRYTVLDLIARKAEQEAAND